MKEDILEAHQSALFLCIDLRKAHKKLCKNKPTLTEKLAERHVLELLAKAVEIKNALSGLL